MIRIIAVLAYISIGIGVLIVEDRQNDDISLKDEDAVTVFLLMTIWPSIPAAHVYSNIMGYTE